MQLENMTTKGKESQYGTVQEFAHFLPFKIEMHKACCIDCELQQLVVNIYKPLLVKG